jgi:hypothetical protein
MIIDIENYQNVNRLEENEIREMCAFLQGAVYCWCKNREGEWFAARDLLGGENYFWEGTPMIRLYEYYLAGDEANNQYAVSEAGKAAGKLLKKVLFEDKRIFETRDSYTREYRWTGGEE